MKTFPVQTSDKVRSEIPSFNEDHAIPVLEWGKKMYILFGDEVRAAIPLCSYLVMVEGQAGCASSNKTFVRFNVAGKGEQDIEVWIVGTRYSAGVRMFKTREDYEGFFVGQTLRELRPEGIPLWSIIKDHGYETGNVGSWDRAVLGWYMDKFEPKQGKIRFKDVWVDEGGVHITFLPKAYYGCDNNKYYLTKEECLAANRREVFDFDDDEPVQEDQQWVVNLPKTVAVTAKTAEEAEQIVRNAINNIVK